MRQQPSGRRPRGRSNRKHYVPHRSQTFDSHGPEVRVRGNAMQVYEKYVNLARDAFSSGDRIAAESYQQYAEHYFRIMNDTTDPQRAAPERPAQERQGQERQGQERQGQERQGQERPEAEQQAGDRSGAEQPTSDRKPYPVNAEQPFVDGGGGAPSGNGQKRKAKPELPEAEEAAEVVEAPEAPAADGKSDGAAAPEKKAKPRGRPRSRAKAGNGAMAEAESNPAAESSQPCEAGEASS